MRLVVVLMGIFAIPFSFILPNGGRAPASGANKCNKIISQIISAERYDIDYFLNRYLSEDGIIQEYMNQFQADMLFIYPNLRPDSLNELCFRFNKSLTEEVDRLVTSEISHPVKSYQRRGVILDKRIQFFVVDLRNQLMGEIDKKPLIRILDLIEDSSLKLRSEHLYRLHHLSKNPTDHIDSVQFSEKVVDKLNRDSNLRSKMLKACDRGVVNHAHNSNGIKRLGDELYEIKDVSLDKRLWGCLDGATLFIHGLTDHKGIDRVGC